MAARSLTLASTAAIPAPRGSDATKPGRSASPHTITEPAEDISTAAPSSPGPAQRIGGTEDAPDGSDRPLGPQASMGADRVHQPVQR